MKVHFLNCCQFLYSKLCFRTPYKGIQHRPIKQNLYLPLKQILHLPIKQIRHPPINRRNHYIVYICTLYLQAVPSSRIVPNFYIVNFVFRIAFIQIPIKQNRHLVMKHRESLHCVFLPIIFDDRSQFMN